MTLTTCGMISPAFSMKTRSPIRTPSRRISSWLCSEARLTVVPASRTGSSTATGVIVPSRPTWDRMSRIRVVACSAGNL
ncbi:MAG: hypothetical protein BWY73_01590 [candidate division TA06 bacterium ADurb.Bin417]|uniref:Uncharacterized protein n=1 Tax=candidate division TA06 bacterium ADurb.Bin417 TaxID=1852828 RepID=A0A1V5M745_UNCT6|nr:MAG: hypothetical protein BWY73_01590 [candidate division TA06 bacterium ADurb.Bin417]